MRVPSWKHEHAPRTQLHPFTFIKALSKRIPVIPAWNDSLYLTEVIVFAGYQLEFEPALLVV
jgi:hypothetical protein